MSSPAERYAAARLRKPQGTDIHGALAEFAAALSFPLDPFQQEALVSMAQNRSVLVAAPTGAGKTVVGEFAAHLAITNGTKCFYTTPIKALSNQKYAELAARYGHDMVGLLTGDNAINGDAPIVIMTTEVLRNMIYAGSTTLKNLEWVVMDEVHYLADRSRGAVWEEVLIQLKSNVKVASLSATVSNAEEFGEWLRTVRGSLDVIVDEVRPVPLWQHVLAGNRLIDIFVDEDQQEVNPQLIAYARDQQRRSRTEPQRGRRGPRWRGPSRFEIVDRLQQENLLPAIIFVFSRGGCDAAVRQCLAAGVRLTTSPERAEIMAIADARIGGLAPEDHDVLGTMEWLDALGRGIAAHHAGMLPVFKEVIEVAFQRGLVKAVFATETLALGINMPARAVVLERLVKWNGETHAQVTPGEYTQLTGRAGRRGIDVEGHAVVVWSDDLDPGSLAGLASTRTYPLRSSFRPSYNMSINLLERLGRAEARDVLETSFAQFQADRAVVGLAASVRRHEEMLRSYESHMSCHLGDFNEYAEMRNELSLREKGLARESSAKRRADIEDSLRAVRLGDVIIVQTGRHAGPAVVVEAAPDVDRDPRPSVMTRDRRVARVSVIDFAAPAQTVSRVRMPKQFNSRSANSRRDLGIALKEAMRGVEIPRLTKHRSSSDDSQITELRQRLRHHPCHSCHDREEHARWGQKWHKVHAEMLEISRRIEGRTNTVARQFDRVLSLLNELGYVAEGPEGLQATPDGHLLGAIYSESDLVVAECIRSGVWASLTPPDLAAAVSALTFESRRDEADVPKIPNENVRTALDRELEIWNAVTSLEREFQIPETRKPDLGFVRAVHQWARGARLEQVLADDMTPGDFVRWTRQIIDLLGQISAASAELATTARAAATALDRGVIAAF